MILKKHECCRIWTRVLFLIAVILGVFFGGGIDAEATDQLVPPKSGKIPVAVVVTQHANLIDFAGPWEVFTSARVPGRGNSKNEDVPEDDQYPFHVYTVGDSTNPVQVGLNLTVMPQYTFENAPTPKIVVVGAQMGSANMKAWLQKVAGDPQTEVIMSVCTGAFRLAAAGLLDGKPATTHHAYYNEFSKHFPKVQVKKNARYVQSDKRIFTSGGLTSGIDLALHIVELYFGEKIARNTAEWLEHIRS
jgi:transcriptional regulator GlxA family with amidase domain